MPLEIPDHPLPPPELARVAVLGAGRRRDALADGLDVGARRCRRLGWGDIDEQRLGDTSDVVVVADTWRTVCERRERVSGALAGVVVIAAIDIVVAGRDSVSVVGPSGGTTPALAGVWSRSRVVGAFHQLTAEHLELAALGQLTCDVPVFGDDREAVDLAEGLIDEMLGLDAVYAGHMAFAAVVEGFAGIVHEVGASAGGPVGFRFGDAGPRFLY